MRGIKWQEHGHTIFGRHLLSPSGFRFIVAIVDQFQFLHQLTANLRDLLLLSPRVLHQQLLLWRRSEGPSIISPHHIHLESLFVVAIYQTDKLSGQYRWTLAMCLTAMTPLRNVQGTTGDKTGVRQTAIRAQNVAISFL